MIQFHILIHFLFTSHIFSLHTNYVFAFQYFCKKKETILTHSNAWKSWFFIHFQRNIYIWFSFHTYKKIFLYFPPSLHWNSNLLLLSDAVSSLCWMFLSRFALCYYDWFRCSLFFCVLFWVETTVTFTLLWTTDPHFTIWKKFINQTSICIRITLVFPIYKISFRMKSFFEAQTDATRNILTVMK